MWQSRPKRSGSQQPISPPLKGVLRPEVDWFVALLLGETATCSSQCDVTGCACCFCLLVLAPCCEIKSSALSELHHHHQYQTPIYPRQSPPPHLSVLATVKDSFRSPCALVQCWVLPLFALSEAPVLGLSSASSSNLATMLATRVFSSPARQCLRKAGTKSAWAPVSFQVSLSVTAAARNGSTDTALLPRSSREPMPTKSPSSRDRRVQTASTPSR